MTSIIINRLFLIALALPLAAGMVAQAQQVDPSQAPLPADPGAIEVPPTTPDAGVTDPAPTWQYQRTTTNRAGTVQNTHQQVTSEDATQGNWYLREHVVTNPRGKMVQSWERSENEEGYLYRRSHTFTAPDETLLRQQEWSTTGTDPYNYTREHQHQLRDGRTIMHRQTRSWDGTTGTMERSFTGPNGQTREFQRPWTPDEPLSPEPGPIVPEPGPIAPEPTATATSPTPPPPAEAIAALSPPAEPPSESRWGWMKKLNPFRKGGPFRSAEAAPPRRAGFTVGSGGPSSTGPRQHGLNQTQPGNPSPNSRRPSWAGPNGGPPPGHSTLSASLPSGRGRNR